MTWLTVRQIGVWKDGITLWRTVAAGAPGVGFVHYNLGNAFKAQGQLDNAAEHYRKAIGLLPQLR